MSFANFRKAALSLALAATSPAADLTWSKEATVDQTEGCIYYFAYDDGHAEAGSVRSCQGDYDRWLVELYDGAHAVANNLEAAKREANRLWHARKLPKIKVLAPPGYRAQEAE